MSHSGQPKTLELDFQEKNMSVTHGDIAHAVSKKVPAAAAAAHPFASLMDLIADTVKQAVVPSFKPAGAKKSSSALRFAITCLDLSKNPTAGYNGGPPGMKYDYLVLVENFGSTPILPSVGERTPEGGLLLRVKGEMPMTDAQQKIAIEKAAENDAKTKRKSTSYVAKKYSFDDGLEEVPLLMHISAFSPLAPFRDERGSQFGPGSRVYLDGLQAVRKYKKNEDPTVRELAFDVQWGVEGMIANTKGAASARSTDLFEIWRGFLKKNYIVNFYKGEGGGWSLNNVTKQDRTDVERWTQEGMLEKNRIRTSKHYIASSERGLLSQPVVIPFGIEARKQPWHLSSRRAVMFIEGRTVFDTNWIETRKPGEPPLRLLTFSTEAVLIQKIFKTKTNVTRHTVEVAMTDRYDEDKLNILGITNPLRYQHVAPGYVPNCSGFFVGSLNVVATAALPINDPELNPLDEVTKKPFKGMNSGIACNPIKISFDLAYGLVTSPNSFEIDAECAAKVIEAQFGAPDPGDQVAAWALANPLNQGSRSVLNMFETNEKLQSLGNTYTYFLVFAINVQARQNVKRARDAILRKGLNPVTELSKAFFTPQPEAESADQYQNAIDGMPRPAWTDPSQSNTYCLFAVRGEEVKRVRELPPALSDGELAKQAEVLAATEYAKSPLPDDPALAKVNDEQGRGGEQQEEHADVAIDPPVSHIEVRRSSTPERQKRAATKGRGSATKTKTMVVKAAVAATEDADADDPLDF